MSTYAVYLNEPDAQAWDAIKTTWPGRYFILTDHLAFVAPEGITTTAAVAEIVGIGEERKVAGIVFDWMAHNGFNRSDLWEWLRKAQS